MKYDLILKNAHIVDPSNGIDDEGSIYIKGGNIEKIVCGAADSDAEIADATEVLDLHGMVAAPGLVDVHVHFRDPGQTHKEDIHTGSMAAINGGFTSVILMANTVPSVDTVDTLEYIYEKAKSEKLHIYSCATVTKGMKGEELIDFDKLKAAGAVGFTDDGKPIMDEALLEEAFNKAAKLKVPVSLHEEDPKCIFQNGVNSEIAGELLEISKRSCSFDLGVDDFKGSPREAEISLIKRDLEIASKTKVMLNIQHISTKEGVELVRNSKKTNPNVHAEATPHHFTLTDEAVMKYGTLAKMNPPLRSKEDRKAIIDGLMDGTIDIIATDHAPHSREEKSQALSKAPSGIIGLETALALGITSLVKPGYLTISELIEKMSLNPALLYNIEAGTLSVGKKADIVVFDPNETWTVGDCYSKSSNSPFIGQKLTGKVKFTICEGQIIA